MSSGYNNNEDEYDPNNKEQYRQTEVREAITFLIEITPEILKPSNDLNQISQLKEILISINELMQELIITSRNTGIGIYFYNCETIPPLKNLLIPTFNSLFKLNVLNLSNMVKLNDLLTNHEDLTSVFKYKKMKEESELNSILSKMINQLMEKKEFNKRRMIWITNNDQPFQKESTLENLKRTVDDFDGFGFIIDPMFISFNHEKPFKFDKFIDIFSNTNFLKINQGDDDEFGGNKRIKLEDQTSPTLFDKSKQQINYQQPILSNQIKKKILSIRNINRVQFSCPLILSDNGSVGGSLGCNIKGYTLYNHEKIKKSEISLYLKEEDIKKVYIKSNLINEKTQNPINLKEDRNLSIVEKKEESGIFKGFPLGGGDDILLLNREQIEFLRNYTFDHRLQEKSETKDIKKEDLDEVEFPDDIEDQDDNNYILSISYSKAPYLKIIGFRDLNTFNPSYICSTPIFISADLNNGISANNASKQSGGFTNSLKTFASLYRSTLKLQKYIIVIGCIRSNSKPHLYAMYPTQTICSSKSDLKNENNTEDVDDELPQGFLLCKLPWLEDFRALPSNYIQYIEKSTTEEESESSLIDRPLVNEFKNLFKNFEINSYKPRDYPNPSLNYYFNVIKHELLQLPFLPTDKSLQKNDITFRKLVDLKKNLTDDDKSTISKIKERIGELSTNSKNSEPLSTTTSKISSTKNNEITTEEILIAWKNNNLNIFNMNQLKQFKKLNPDIQTAVKKQDMINNISDYLEKNIKKMN
ncbi:KU70 [Candida pseudojiufengensis]|uniref:KU70 n=1 Tax=Candida pseudojiufengensis TaxID=497109 RepID=UPI002224B7CA|nr:KU70 [Candida pseudojiufengensis]KAI5963671.1 KU70 [Candida pseudojiufengensis]